MSDNFNKDRIIKNSVTLYVRMMFTMFLNLLTTRFVLSALGVEDMGVYGVVGSVVSMFTVFVSGLLSAAQRYITFELGKTNGNVNNVFNTSTNLILLLSIVLFAVMEIGGIWMLECNLNIPENSMEAARWVLQFSIFVCILNLNSTTYNALIIAHERMSAWAVISIIQVVLSCLSAYSLTLFAIGYRLFWYALLGFIIQVIIQLMYIGYCKYHFPETKHKYVIDRVLVHDMAKYAGASTFSGVLQMIISQGIILIINWTYGIAVNAVYNIGMQVKNSVLSFGLNIQKSISPQITKTYASGEIDTHLRLVYSGSKMGVYMILFILIPFCLRSHYIMALWLGTVPNYTSLFAVGFVFQSLLYAGFEPFRTAVLATGDVARFFIYSELIHTLVLPLSYLAGIGSQNPTYLVLVIIFMEFVYCAVMVWFGTRVSMIKIRDLAKYVVLPVMLVFTLSSMLCYALSSLLPQNFLGLVAQLLFGSMIILSVILLVGINDFEKKLVYATLNKVRDWSRIR